MMLFCHILDDYVLQAASLNKLKQKSWWEENASDEMYKNDYKCGLVMHALSWSFMIMLPILIFNFTTIWYSVGYTIGFVMLFAFNAIIHGYIDNYKANHHSINLIADQSLHVAQIAFTVVLWYICMTA
jgi:hypothetical protein